MLLIKTNIVALSTVVNAKGSVHLFTMMRALYKFIFNQMGWQVQGSFTKLPQKFIIIVAPHTSNWDFVLGIMVRSMLGLRQTKYLGKSELFRFPYGFIFRALGGYPVERHKYNNLVEATVALFNSKDTFSIALAPEGTRAKVNRLKTGFYHIANQANLPIYKVGFDFAHKQVIIDEPFYPTGNIIADFKPILTFFSKIKGKNRKLGIDENAYELFVSAQEK